MNALRLPRRKRVAYLQARCAMLEHKVRIAARLGAAYGADDGQDAALYDAGHMILELRDAGRTDSEIVGDLLDLVALRMMAGMDDAVGQLTAED